ncbi:putative 2-oxoglutarate oxidoreductase, delta subunit [Methanocaldococcus lauensis]|uniref:Putative 2-oxoglutarate oxidoreductase, delta subunit n=1 Tax=Methanocaldococcus lauensis TaxID=2546128 RepID=A0A8D6SV63_9EURY|nr:putative 2-oxoglutarate oxidoreductase, delta subunit [Methanocaldococcus lauensis]CAB3289777.1 putative 2-oxoglutarate oxidoreductase, delta subunit [Methanocaldococcus lauensis]
MKVDIKINEDFCKGCEICIVVCPKKVYEKSKKLNKRGVYPPIPVNADKCTLCNLCILQCPDQAISIDVQK